MYEAFIVTFKAMCKMQGYIERHTACKKWESEKMECTGECEKYVSNRYRGDWKVKKKKKMDERE